MTAQTAPKKIGLAALIDNIRQRPALLGGLLVLYMFIGLYLLWTLDRESSFFHLNSIWVFPLVVLSPVVVLATPIHWRYQAVLIFLLLFVAIPILGMRDSKYLDLITLICIYAGLALGLNIVVGFAGLLDLGYIAFFAVGAYLWAMYTSNVDTYFKINQLLVPASSFYLFMIIGVVLAAVVGIFLGLPVLRLRGDYLAIVTLGFGEMIRVLARNADAPINFTNGPKGLDGVPGPPIPQVLIDAVNNISATVNNIVPSLGLPGVSITNPTNFAGQLLLYFICIVVIALIMLVARRLDNSPIGRAWTAIREDEVAAIAMGVPLVRMKLLAFAMGASFAGAIGVIFGAKQSFVSPESFSLIQSISILAMVIVGGIGGIKSAIFGGCIVTLLNLHVLKELSLQINDWRNADVVVPAFVLALIIAGIAAFIGWLVVRSDGVSRWVSQQFKLPERGLWRWGVVLAAAVIAVLLFQPSDFAIRNWPNQLEPAKYERLIFGIILIVMMIFRPAGLMPEARRKLELQEARAEESGELMEEGE